MIHSKTMALIGTLAGLLGCSTKTDLQTVAYVEPEKYMGLWYDVSSYPVRFQKDCKCTTAEYALMADGNISVKNTCIDKNTGEEKGITGKAFIDDNQTNAKLKVQFFWPFKAPYWVIDLAPDYSYAVVSEPKKDYLWILSRTPNMAPELLAQIKKNLETKGYDINRLQDVVHDCAD